MQIPWQTLHTIPVTVVLPPLCTHTGVCRIRNTRIDRVNVLSQFTLSLMYRFLALLGTMRSFLRNNVIWLPSGAREVCVRIRTFHRNRVAMCCRSAGAPAGNLREVSAYAGWYRI